MAGLHNTLRRLVVDGTPVATGLHAIGDSVCTTNPTLGRAWPWPYPAPQTWPIPSASIPQIPSARRSPWTASSARTWCRSTTIRP
jgi:type II secretory pathway pseudopilin PulG